MKAVVYRGVRDLRVEAVPVPRIGSSELLVKVAACGVCPTDIKKIHYGTVPPPRIFGHETAGTIVKAGAKVAGFRVGERVALHHHVPCLKCHACRHRAFAQCATYKRTGITAGFEPAGGGFAEYVRVMPFVLPGVVKIPAKNSFQEGAMLEPVNTILKGVRRLSLLKGDAVWVVGQGPIGLMFTRLLSLQGARVIASDLLETRLQFARKFGAAKAVHGGDAGLAETMRKFSGGRGLDAVVLAVPSDEALETGLKLLRGAGQMLLFAHTRRGAEAKLDLSDVCVDEKDLLGSYSSDVTLQAASAKVVFSRQLDVRQLITHEFPLEEAPQAIEMAAAPVENALKIMVRP